MRLEAPDPLPLVALLESLTYKPGWSVTLIQSQGDGRGSSGPALQVAIEAHDAYDHERVVPVCHWFPLPATTYNERSWRRWLFDRIVDVERHEAMEFFQIGATKPYAPHHGPGENAYTVYEHGSVEDTMTNFRGEVL